MDKMSAGANTRDSGDPARAELKNQGQDDLRTLGLFEPDIWPSEDVFVCGSGIGFEYDRYQIAPWCIMGEFILVLPWSEVKPISQPGAFIRRSFPVNPAGHAFARLTVQVFSPASTEMPFAWSDHSIFTASVSSATS